MDPPRARIAFVAGSSGKEKHTRAKHMRISSQSLQLPTISGAMNTIIHENRPEQCFPSSWNGAGVTLRRASSAVPHFDDLSRQMQSTAVEIRNKPRRRTFGCCMYGEGRKQKTATHLSHSRTAQTQTVWPRPAYKGILTARVCYNIEGTMYAVPGCVSIRAKEGVQLIHIQLRPADATPFRFNWATKKHIMQEAQTCACDIPRCQLSHTSLAKDPASTIQLVQAEQRI